jgi:hypothetical protein
MQVLHRRHDDAGHHILFCHMLHSIRPSYERTLTHACDTLHLQVFYGWHGHTGQRIHVWYVLHGAPAVPRAAGQRR